MPPHWAHAGAAMQDIAMLAFTAVFFAVAYAYVKACHTLR